MRRYPLRYSVLAIIALFVAVLVCAGAFSLCSVGAPSPAYANSAERYFEGSSATGAVMRGDSPIIVENELLTFDIDEFPERYYDNNEKFLSYGGKVTAQYSFYNPSEYTVTSTLCFPFGKLPSYSPYYFYDDGAGDASKYSVSVNGYDIATSLRHTFSYPYEQFDVNRDLAMLNDEYISHEFFTPDLSVVKYTYIVEDLDEDDRRANRAAAFEITNTQGNARVYFPNMSMMSTVDDGVFSVGCWVEKGSEITLYAFGVDLSDAYGDNMPQWKFYANGSCEDEIYGIMSAPALEQMTLEEFALEGRDEDSAVSEIDWYNAVVTQLISRGGKDDIPAITLAGYGKDLVCCLMRWYEYSLTLAPHERAINVVTAPIYPTIADRYDPPVYHYTYLLSPAKTWASFGELEIKINTPYYLVEYSSIAADFEKSDEGYSIKLGGLPNGELNFALSASEDPKPDESGSILWGLLAIVLFFVNILGGILSSLQAYLPAGVSVAQIFGALCFVKVIIDILGGIIILIVHAALKAKRKRDRSKK